VDSISDEQVHAYMLEVVQAWRDDINWQFYIEQIRNPFFQDILTKEAK